jgi:poly-gamma-glutamate synthesis protein (capsule biosynthesis protein)
MRRYILPILLVAVIFALSSARVRERLFPNTDLLSSAGKILTPEDVKPVTLVLVGDIMMDRGVRRSVGNTFGGDYSAMFTHTSYLKDADIAFANLEGTVAESGRNVGSRFSFHMNPIVASTLGDAGFDIVSFANNHVGDWDRAAFDETLLQLQEAQVKYAGAGTNYADASTPRIVTVRGMKIGFIASTDVGPKWLAATDTKSGILLSSDPKLPDIVRAAKAQVDVLVVSFHWGNEYSPANAHQQALAHAVIDAGADIVVGHHPHVMERVEEYNGKPIFYSLGNFIFDQSFSPHTMHGMVATVSIDPSTKTITHTEQVSPLSRQFVPQPLVPFDTSMLVSKTFVP